MELTLEPEIYCPIINENGDYVDSCPNFISNGIRCPCGSRGDWVYENKAKFKQHILGLKHKKWLKSLNNNKLNFYEENIKLKDTIKNQREIIAKLEIEKNNLKLLNSYIEAKLFNTPNKEINLLDLN